MFIMILEGGKPQYAQAVTQDEMDAADSGILEILDLCLDNERGDIPKTYWEGEWIELGKWGE